jgi:hypothetical protein
MTRFAFPGLSFALGATVRQHQGNRRTRWQHHTTRFGDRLRQRLGIKRYDSFAAMPPGLRFFFMGTFGLEGMLVALQLKRVTPLVATITDHFDDWRVIAHATAGQLVMVSLLLAYTAWLLFMGWISTNIFRTCRGSLEHDLFC